jgi:hypothetical protein
VQPSVSALSKFWLFPAILSLGFAVGCGNGGSLHLLHQIGNYSNASLNGQYVYQVHGEDLTFGLYREVGVFTADGAGNITGGKDDFAVGGLVSNSITGTYTIASDGTGFIQIGPTALGTITFAVTLASSSKAYLMEADVNTDGAGTAELQDTTATGTIPSGAFVYRLHRITSQNIVSEAGAIAVSGGAVTGSFDQNNTGTFTQLTLTGSLNSPTSLGRGTGSFTDSNNVTTNLVYYIVNGGKVALLSSNTNVIESGSAEAQTGAVGNGLAGSYVFGSRGDLPGITFDGIATIGQFAASGGTISSYMDDSMQLGVYSNASGTGTYTASANGRVAVSLNSGAVQQVFWMINPSRAFFLTNDPNKVEDGTADAQIAPATSPASMQGQFAMGMDGIDLTPEILARNGTLQFDGAGKLDLVELVNASASGTGAQSPGTLTGTYQVSGGRVVGTLNGLNLVLYTISGSDAYALQVDSGTNTSGVFELQH